VFLTSFVGKTSNPALVLDRVPLGFCQNKAKWRPHGANNLKKYFGFGLKLKPYAQNELIVHQIRELRAGLD
jgi:hypothetical protein